MAEALCTDSMGSTDSTTYFSISLLLIRAGKLYRQYFSVLISCLCGQLNVREKTFKYSYKAQTLHAKCRTEDRRGEQRRVEERVVKKHSMPDD